MKIIKIIFKYLENFWTGQDGKPSLRSLLSIIISFHFLNNVSYAVKKWDANKSLADLTLLLTLEVGFVISLLGLKAITNIAKDKLESLKPKENDI